MIKRLVIIILFLLIIVSNKQDVYAENNVMDSDYTNIDYIELDYTDIEEVLEDILSIKDFSFSGYVKNLISGNEVLKHDSLISIIKSSLIAEINNSKNVFVKMIIIGIVSAIFFNFSNVFTNSQISEISFYITYLLMFTIVTSSFVLLSNLATATLSAIISFMKVLIPVFFVAVGFSSGVTTSMLFYETTFIIITVADTILIKILLPLINVYMIINLVNHISKEEFLSRLSNLIKLIIEWSLKTIFAVVIGFNTIQGLIIPMADGIKSATLSKVTSLIPGVGKAFNLATETILGSSTLIKNAIGVAGLFTLVLICAIPVIKSAVFVLMYELAAGVMQPVSDKRLIGCISTASQSGKLLIKVIFVGVVLFLATIAIITASTNSKLYTR